MSNRDLRRARSALALALLPLAVASCSSHDDGGGDPPRGESGGALDYDAAGIPVGSDDLRTGGGDHGGGEGGTGGGAAAGSGGGGSGGGGGTTRCTGVETPCDLVGSYSCGTVDGCHASGECDGYATSCSYKTSSYSCSSQQGCYWSSYSTTCSGSARSCVLMSSEYSCIDQDGCYWTPTCAGYATPCSLMPISLCTSQPGCRLETN